MYSERCSNKSVFSYLRTLTTWHCPHSPTGRRCCSNRSISLANGFAAMGLCWSRQTDTVPFHTPCSACYAGSTSNRVFNALRQSLLRVAVTITKVGRGSGCRTSESGWTRWSVWFSGRSSSRMRACDASWSYCSSSSSSMRLLWSLRMTDARNDRLHSTPIRTNRTPKHAV